ncbi:MAG TPA: hypothetical protein PKU94_03420 [Candidatus Hydrothermia bacterium]|nr:hypothetical protein [Candidatus Hydrothermae bacterium]MDD3649338.1 hypothetical protein [Candidatus Hydrothermia bacterium]MDD5572566.1 hypothetical protein [Candidatus Hydrothermia bacterium]HOK22753.1 hypothetical protein [Candidatus Hydrothermia bacterium]HOL23462.1 hypothetical protein [Candidatus Hydrothermia bacterium]
MSVIISALNYISQRFGIPQGVFEGFELVEKGDIWIMSKEAARFHIKRYSRKGIRLIRVFRDGYKLTTAGIQIFGKYATRNVLEINEKQLEDFLKGKNLLVANNAVQNGQVIVKSGTDYLGSALYNNGNVKNQLPKGRRWF